MLITSLDNKKVKLIKELNERKNRLKYGFFVVFGEHLVEEAIKSGFIFEIYILEGEEFQAPKDVLVYYLTREVMKKICPLSSIPSVLGVCKINNKNEIKGDHILILEDIQDPGNLGTIIRTSCAFSVDTIILSPNTVDIYNDKVIRSTQGMIFNVNYVVMDVKKAILYLKEKNYSIYGTDVLKGEDARNVNASRYALIMGNEGQGVREETKKMCDKFLYIKMNNKCESLNVSVATSILLYELGYQHE